MYFRVTRPILDREIVAGSRVVRLAPDEDELVGYVESESWLDAVLQAQDTFGEAKLKVVPISGDPDDDIWPPGSEAWRNDLEDEADAETV